MRQGLDEICTMCDAPIDKFAESYGTTCEKCGTRFEILDKLIESCDPLFSEGLFDSPLFILSAGERVKTDVPQSVYDEFVALEKEKKDDKIYARAHEVIEKYPNDASANFLAAVVLSNVLIRKVQTTNLDEIKLNSKKMYDEPLDDYGEIINLFNKAGDLFEEKSIKDMMPIYQYEFKYMYEFAYFDNAIEKMSNFVKSKDAEDLLYGIETNVMTEDELKTLQYIENKEEIEKKAKKEMKKKHFFPKNIFGSLGLILCMFVVVCAIIYPYVPAAKYWISGTFYDWVGVGIAGLIILARIIYVIKDNRDTFLVYKHKILEELNKTVETKSAPKSKSDAKSKNENIDRIKSLIEKSNKLREEKGDDYCKEILAGLIDKYIHLSKEEFVCKCYAEIVIILRMIETDLKNENLILDDINSLGVVIWEDYCMIKEISENMEVYRKVSKT